MNACFYESKGSGNLLPLICVIVAFAVLSELLVSVASAWPYKLTFCLATENAMLNAQCECVWPLGGQNAKVWLQCFRGSLRMSKMLLTSRLGHVYPSLLGSRPPQ